MVALPGSYVQGRVPMVVDSMEVALGIQEDFSDGSTTREGGPVQADVFFLGGEGQKTGLQTTPSLN